VSRREVVNILINSARGAQLKTLARIKGVTVTELLELFIRDEIGKGKIPDELPGFAIVVANGHVCIETVKLGLPPFVPAHARQIAALLRHAADKTPNGRGNKIAFGPDADMTLAIAREGRGVSIKIDNNIVERSEKIAITPGMARDLARIIDRAADQAQAPT
jgi:hypothetical protein